MDQTVKEIIQGIYLVGRADKQDSKSCHVYLLDWGELILIDAGTGKNFQKIINNVQSLGFDPFDIKTLILTHCHVDHSAGALQFREQLGCKLVMHTLDAGVLERGDNQLSAGNWFRIPLRPTPIDQKLSGDLNILSWSGRRLHCLHTPGHSPGSMSLYTDVAGKRVLFGQDIHAPIIHKYQSDETVWRQSMQKLLALRADILCEGHLGVMEPAEKVAEFIEYYLRNLVIE
jgi:glyoxylase-like metal-dependent hydrolase (beta-lactamase superfamily II)